MAMAVEEADQPTRLVAQVAVDLPLAHLDRPFDYLVPDELVPVTRPGVRVRVRFAGRLLDGFVLGVRRLGQGEADAEAVGATPELVPVPSDALPVGPKLAPLRTVVSPEVVLTPSQVTHVRAVADHYAGTFADVVRAAVPPRHAATERATPRPWPQPATDETCTPDEAPATAVPPAAGEGPRGDDQVDTQHESGQQEFGQQEETQQAETQQEVGLKAQARPPDPWAPVEGAEGFLGALRQGHSPRGWWQVPAVHGIVGDLSQGVGHAVAAVLASGRGAVVVAPDVSAAELVAEAVEDLVGRGTVARLHHDLGPSTRYRNYLACVRGSARVCVGTRGAAFAPVRDLGLVVVVDDGDDLHASPQAPYPHARTVAALRVPIEGCGLLVASHACSTEVAAWLEHGWLHPLQIPRPALRRSSPRVVVTGDSDAALERDPLARQVRLPHLVFETLRVGLSRGPVLVQVPRSGHLVVLVCQRCRAALRCEHCSGPVRGEPRRGLECAQCGRTQQPHPCAACGHLGWRAPLVGASLTAEQLTRAFPGTEVVDSSGDHVVAEVDDQPRLVVATPGAEPRARQGYSAAVLLDASTLLGRADLRAAEEALRRWLRATALVVGGEEGGTVCVVGPPEDPTVQALVRLDPRAHAEREWEQRRAARLPPAARVVTIEGTTAGVSEFRDALDLAAVDPVEVLGPVDLPPQTSPVGGELDHLVRLTLRCPSAVGPQLVEKVKAGLAARSSRKGVPVRVRVDPVALG